VRGRGRDPDLIRRLCSPGVTRAWPLFGGRAPPGRGWVPLRGGPTFGSARARARGGYELRRDPLVSVRRGFARARTRGCRRIARTGEGSRWGSRVVMSWAWYRWAEHRSAGVPLGGAPWTGPGRRTRPGRRADHRLAGYRWAGYRWAGRHGRPPDETSETRVSDKTRPPRRSPLGGAPPERPTAGRGTMGPGLAAAQDVAAAQATAARVFRPRAAPPPRCGSCGTCVARSPRVAPRGVPGSSGCSPCPQGTWGCRR